MRRMARDDDESLVKIFCHPSPVLAMALSVTQRYFLGSGTLSFESCLTDRGPGLDYCPLGHHYTTFRLTVK